MTNKLSMINPYNFAYDLTSFELELIKYSLFLKTYPKTVTVEMSMSVTIIFEFW